MSKGNIRLFQFIKYVTDKFYETAQKDIIIGYHFRHIENFNTHLPKIYQFWAQQLLSLSKEEKNILFKDKYSIDIFKKHAYLKIKKGEVGRWVLLFQQAIDNSDNQRGPDSDIDNLKILWIKKLEFFHKKFVESQELFPS